MKKVKVNELFVELLRQDAWFKLTVKCLTQTGGKRGSIFLLKLLADDLLHHLIYQFTLSFFVTTHIIGKDVQHKHSCSIMMLSTNIQTLAGSELSCQAGLFPGFQCQPLKFRMQETNGNWSLRAVPVTPGLIVSGRLPDAMTLCGNPKLWSSANSLYRTTDYRQLCFTSLMPTVAIKLL